MMTKMEAEEHRAQPRPEVSQFSSLRCPPLPKVYVFLNTAVDGSATASPGELLLIITQRSGVFI